MSKIARTAALVVGAVALAATGIGALASAGIIGGTITTATGATVLGFAGVAASTFTAIGAVAGFAGALLGMAAGAVKPGGSVGGFPSSFAIDATPFEESSYDAGQSVRSATVRPSFDGQWQMVGRWNPG